MSPGVPCAGCGKPTGRAAVKNARIYCGKACFSRTQPTTTPEDYEEWLRQQKEAEEAERQRVLNPRGVPTWGELDE